MEGCGVLQGSAKLHEQFFLAHIAEQSLRDLARNEQPFCLVASFWGPHHPYYPSEEFAELVGSIIENPYLNGTTIRLDGAVRLAPK